MTHTHTHTHSPSCLLLTCWTWPPLTRREAGEDGRSFPIVKVRSRKALLFKDRATADDFQEQYSAFLRRSRTDVHQDSRVEYSIPGYDTDHRLLAVKAGQYYVSFMPKSPLGEFSTKSLQLGFWLSTLLGMSIPFRIWLESKCGVATLMFVKEVEARRKLPVLSAG